MTFQDKNMNVMKQILKAVEKNKKIEFSKLRDTIVFNHGISKENAEDKIKTLSNIDKISYLKENNKVFICPFQKQR